MIDKLTPAARSRNMGRIGSKNTSPELTVRRVFHRFGLRYRLHVKDLPGKPDIVLVSRRTCVFVHGCFWHGCPHCSEGRRVVGSNQTYWLPKLAGNKARDERHAAALAAAGWRVELVWECEARNERLLAELAKKLLAIPSMKAGLLQAARVDRKNIGPAHRGRRRDRD